MHNYNTTHISHHRQRETDIRNKFKSFHSEHTQKKKNLYLKTGERELHEAIQTIQFKQSGELKHLKPRPLKCKVKEAEIN